MDKKLEKIKLNKLEMGQFFGGEEEGTSKNTTSQKGNCTDDDTTADINGLVFYCEAWTCPDN